MHLHMCLKHFKIFSYALFPFIHFILVIRMYHRVCCTSFYEIQTMYYVVTLAYDPIKFCTR